MCAPQHKKSSFIHIFHIILHNSCQVCWFCVHAFMEPDDLRLQPPHHHIKFNVECVSAEIEKRKKSHFKMQSTNGNAQIPNETCK